MGGALVLESIDTARRVVGAIPCGVNNGWCQKAPGIRDKNNGYAFGKNQACGNGAKDFADNEKEATVEVLESNEELDTMMECNHNVPRTHIAQVDEITNGLHDVAKLLSDALNKAVTTMSQDIDFEEDLRKKRGMITNDIFKMTSLNQQEMYEGNGKDMK
ncbi:hypothetical protein Tco_0778556 [Tanacetum coccineum]